MEVGVVLCRLLGAAMTEVCDLFFLSAPWRLDSSNVKSMTAACRTVGPLGALNCGSGEESTWLAEDRSGCSFLATLNPDDLVGFIAELTSDVRSELCSNFEFALCGVAAVALGTLLFDLLEVTWLYSELLLLVISKSALRDTTLALDSFSQVICAFRLFLIVRGKCTLLTENTHQRGGGG